MIRDLVEGIIDLAIGGIYVSLALLALACMGTFMGGIIFIIFKLIGRLLNGI